MKITIITMWYNEAFLAPFFLNHYSYADKIHLLLDADTNDDTRKICERYSNVEIEDFIFPDMMDDDLKIIKINETAARQTADWIFAVDSDEFIFPANGEDVFAVLTRQTANLLYADMWQVYRHQTEANLDSSLPTIWQRRHGDPNRTTGNNGIYRKPIIVKSGLNINWIVGCHGYRENPKIQVSNTRFNGAHWQMADVNMAIERRIKGRRERQSQHNLQTRMTYQHHHITEEEIRAECEKHLNDPLLFSKIGGIGAYQRYFKA